MPNYWGAEEKSLTDPELIEAAVERIFHAHNFNTNTTIWGMLPKALDDDQTILEAVAALIAAHEADEEAHLGVGESLQSHRASEIIDHLAASVVQDKILDGEINLAKKSWNEFEYNTCFDSIDAWNKDISKVEIGVAGMLISSGSVNQSYGYLNAEGYGDSEATNFAKNMLFQTAFKLGQITSQVVKILMGGYDFDGTSENFGFRINNGTLYAMHTKSDGDVETIITTEITGITLTNFNVFRAEFDISSQSFKFYVNGILKATHTTDIPSGSTPELFLFQIHNDEAVNKYLYVKYLSISKTL